MKHNECILKLEQEYIANAEYDFSKIVWMVVTDSAYLKQRITDMYTSANVVVQTTSVANKTNAFIPREIVTTTSRGTHTRTKRNPSTADFAEGMLDWYPIGESDLVFINRKYFTYGTTAALRTNRRVYESASCTELTLIHEEDPPTLEDFEAKKREDKKKREAAKALSS